VAGLHGQGRGTEPVVVDKVHDFRGGIIGHEEVDPMVGQERKQGGMVDAGVRIEASARLLAAGCRVGRVDEDSGPPASAAQEEGQKLQPVPLDEGEPIGMVLDLDQTLDQGFGIPARAQPLAVFARLAERGSGRQHPAVPGAVEDQGAEPVLGDAGRTRLFQGAHPVQGRLKLADPLAEGGPAVQRGPPERGHIAVDLDHHRLGGPLLHHRRQRGRGPAGKGFDQEIGTVGLQPGPNVGDQPRLATGIPEGTALGDAGDIDHGDPREREVGHRGRGAHAAAPVTSRPIKGAVSACTGWGCVSVVSVMGSPDGIRMPRVEGAGPQVKEECRDVGPPTTACLHRRGA